MGDTLNGREKNIRRNREEGQKKREARCYVWGMDNKTLEVEWEGEEEGEGLGGWE